MVPSHFCATGRPTSLPSTQKIATASCSSIASRGSRSMTAIPGPPASRALTRPRKSRNAVMANCPGPRSNTGRGSSCICCAIRSDSSRATSSNITTHSALSTSAATQARASSTRSSSIDALSSFPRSIQSTENCIGAQTSWRPIDPLVSS